MRREDLFTVVHELFMTDTAALADLVLPAPSQLEMVDLEDPVEVGEQLLLRERGGIRRRDAGQQSRGHLVPSGSAN